MNKTAVAMKVRPKYEEQNLQIKARCVRLACELLADKILDREILECKKVVKE